MDEEKTEVNDASLARLSKAIEKFTQEVQLQSKEELEKVTKNTGLELQFLEASLIGNVKAVWEFKKMAEKIKNLEKYKEMNRDTTKDPPTRMEMSRSLRGHLAKKTNNFLKKHIQGLQDDSKFLTSDLSTMKVNLQNQISEIDRSNEQM